MKNPFIRKSRFPAKVIAERSMPTKTPFSIQGLKNGTVIVPARLAEEAKKMADSEVWQMMVDHLRTRAIEKITASAPLDMTGRERAFLEYQAVGEIVTGIQVMADTLRFNKPE